MASNLESRSVEDSRPESPAEEEPASEPAEQSADPDKVRGSHFKRQSGARACIRDGQSAR